MATIADVINSLVTAIEAESVTDPVSEDDRFRVAIGGDAAAISRGSRVVLLGATCPQPVKPGRTCSDYETTITLAVTYANAERSGTYLRALLDSEVLAAAILLWGGTATDVLSAVQTGEDVAPNGDGWLIASRSIIVQYSRGA